MKRKSNFILLSIERSSWWIYPVGSFLVLSVGFAFDLAWSGGWFQRFGATLGALLAFVAFFDPKNRADWIGQRELMLKRYDDEMKRQPNPADVVFSLSAGGVGKISEGQRDRLKRMKEQEDSARRTSRAKLLNEKQREIVNQSRSVHAQQWCIVVSAVAAIFGDLIIPLLKCGAMKC